MKATNITYWISSSVVGLMMTFSAYMYLTQPMMKTNFELMGFHDSFRIELAIAKLLGSIALLASVGMRMKEWAYAGFMITFISAIVTHLSFGHPVQTVAMPGIFLVILGVSWYTNRKRQVQAAL